jgi:hypothetical protein
VEGTTGGRSGGGRGVGGGSSGGESKDDGDGQVPEFAAACIAFLASVAGYTALSDDI